MKENKFAKKSAKPKETSAAEKDFISGAKHKGLIEDTKIKVGRKKIVLDDGVERRTINAKLDVELADRLQFEALKQKTITGVIIDKALKEYFNKNS